MAYATDTERGATVLAPDAVVCFKEKAGGSINAHCFCKIASDGDAEAAGMGDPVIGVLHSVLEGTLNAVAGNTVSITIGRGVCLADIAVLAGQRLKSGAGGKAVPFVDSDLSGDTIEDNVGLGFTNQPANDGLEILSSSASDIQLATVYGTTQGTDTVVAEEITLTGTVAVSTVKTDWGLILGVKVAAAAVGTITFREASGNATVTTIAPAATSSGIIAVTAGQTLAYNVAPTAVADAGTTKQVGLIGTDENAATLYDSQALTGATPVTFNDTFRTVTSLLVGDLEVARTVTVKVGAEDSAQIYAGKALEAAAAGAIFDALILPTGVQTGDIALLDGVTAGVVTASKAVVVDTNKDIGDFRNLDVVNLDAGSSGAAGSVDVFPSTAARGKTALVAADNTGDTTTTITNAAQAGARTYTVPDAGASASFVMTEGAQTINGAKTFGSVPILVGQEYQLTVGPKVGATAGWVIGAADNLGDLATLPQSQTGSTIVLRVTGLKVGWTITAFKVEAQVEAAGNTVTIDADLRKLTNTAADPVDASVGAITQVSVTADTKVEAAKTALAEFITADEWFYILITATTGANCDIRLLGCTVTVTQG